MKTDRILLTSILGFFCLAIFLQFSAAAQSLKEGNEVLFEQLQHVHGLSDSQIDSFRAIFRASGYIGQGNPAITEHPLSPQR